jgi:hypothetical protein
VTEPYTALGIWRVLRYEREGKFLKKANFRVMYFTNVPIAENFGLKMKPRVRIFIFKLFKKKRHCKSHRFESIHENRLVFFVQIKKNQCKFCKRRVF